MMYDAFDKIIIYPSREILEIDPGWRFEYIQEEGGNPDHAAGRCK